MITYDVLVAVEWNHFSGAGITFSVPHCSSLKAIRYATNPARPIDTTYTYTGNVRSAKHAAGVILRTSTSANQPSCSAPIDKIQVIMLVNCKMDYYY